MNFRRILSQIALVAGALLFSVGVQTFAAFTAPTTAPPGADAYAPLHTGSGAQSKAGGLLLNTGGATNGLIVQSGNVGIGTTNPGAKLNIVTSNTAAAEALRLENSGTGGHQSYISFRSSSAAENTRIYGGAPDTASGAGSFKVQASDNSGYLHDYITINGDSYGNYIAFNTATGPFNDPNNIVSPERLRITNAGNVGIGTASPSQKLEVDGNVQISGTIRGASYGFGGMYTVLGDQVSCGYPNPITGSCSCPSGFSASPGNYTTATLVTYFCYK